MERERQRERGRENGPYLSAAGEVGMGRGRLIAIKI